jgi:hypothetical protein
MTLCGAMMSNHTLVPTGIYSRSSNWLAAQADAADRDRLCSLA